MIGKFIRRENDQARDTVGNSVSTIENCNFDSNFGGILINDTKTQRKIVRKEWGTANLKIPISHAITKAILGIKGVCSETDHLNRQHFVISEIDEF